MKRHALKQFIGPLAFTLAYAACLHLASTTHPAAYTAACLAPLIAWGALAQVLAHLYRGQR